MELNLTDILIKKLYKNKRLQIWCDLCGDVIVKKVVKDTEYSEGSITITDIRSGQDFILYTDGRIYPHGNCIIWPSNTNHDWNTF